MNLTRFTINPVQMESRNHQGAKRKKEFPLGVRGGKHLTHGTRLALLFAYGSSRVMAGCCHRGREERGAPMERGDLPDKLFAEDTLPHPNSVDGERPTGEAQQTAVLRDDDPDASSDDMLAVKYREDEVQTAADPLEHAPSPEDVYEPGGGNASPGADIGDEAPPDRGGKTY